MIRTLIALCLALCPAVAAGQAAPDAARHWRQSDGRATFVANGVDLPTQAGTITLQDISEFRAQGRGYDNGLQYRSADGEVFGTVYVYLPGLAHVGLSAFATEQGIRVSSGDQPVRIGARRRVSAGGRDGVAILAAYDNYRGSLASRAAFMKVGRWMVKIRVSGPQARAAEVDAAMTALLDGLRFGNGARPNMAVPLDVERCDGADGVDAMAATARPDQTLADAAVAALDGGDAGGRVPDGWCLSTILRIQNSAAALLRATARGGDADPAGGRSVLFVILSDAGDALELVETPGDRRFVLFHHAIGETRVLGTYAGIPTDRQIAAIVNGNDDAAARVRAIVRLRPNGDTEIGLGSGAGETSGGS